MPGVKKPGRSMGRFGRMNPGREGSDGREGSRGIDGRNGSRGIDGNDGLRLE